MRDLYWSIVSRSRRLFQRDLPVARRYLRAVLRSKLRHPPADRTATSMVLLAWEFPPYVSGGVYRPASIARYGAERGWDIQVFAGSLLEEPSPAGLALAADLPIDVPVRSVTASPSGADCWPAPRIDGGTLNALALFEAADALMAGRPRGVLLASGPPFHSFVAAAWLARRHRWKLVLDYRDEWTQSPHGFNRQDASNVEFERRCLAAADLVVFTTASQIEHQLAQFPGLHRDKCALVHNGWEPADFQVNAAARTCSTSGPLGTTRIAFVGNLGPWWEIESFLTALERAMTVRPSLRDQVALQFVGNIAPSVRVVVERFANTMQIDRPGHLPKLDACQVMVDADILLMPNPKRLARYIPGKTYEYVASGRPVLVFGEGGEVSAIVHTLDAGRVVNVDDTLGLVTALHELPSHQPIDPARRSRWLSERTRAAGAQALFDAAEALLPASRGCAVSGSNGRVTQ